MVSTSRCGRENPGRRQTTSRRRIPDGSVFFLPKFTTFFLPPNHPRPLAAPSTVDDATSASRLHAVSWIGHADHASRGQCCETRRSTRLLISSWLVVIAIHGLEGRVGTVCVWGSWPTQSRDLGPSSTPPQAVAMTPRLWLGCRVDAAEVVCMAHAAINRFFKAQKTRPTKRGPRPRPIVHRPWAFSRDL